MRFGFLDDAVSLRVHKAFAVERRQQQTLQTLTEIQSVAAHNAFQFLILPASFEQTRALLLCSPVTVQADCIVVFSDVPPEPGIACLA